MKHIKKFNESSDSYKEQLLTMVGSETPMWKIMDFLREKIDYVTDGVWDISDIDFIEVSPQYVRVDKSWRKLTNEELNNHIEKLSDFLDKYPNCVIADAYQTNHPFLLERKPTIKVDYLGSGFNHGSNNIIESCPKRILICGEDD
jgi:hypothetical protein